MHCLYCDQPLALLKRLTGDAEFCSKEHRKTYQQEHNRLALERLLESKPRGKQKPRPENREVVAQVAETIARVKKAEAPTPSAAGYIQHFFEARPAGRATQTAGVPRLREVSAVWTGAGAKQTISAHPKRAGSVAERANGGNNDGTLRFPGKPSFDRKSVSLGVAARAARETQPGATGFVPEQFMATPQNGQPRRTDARVAPYATVATPANVHFQSSSTLRPGQFLPGDTAPRTTAGRLSSPALETRWKPLAPALPVRAPADIVLVLGALLQRPFRLARQEQMPDVFQIPFVPVTFPQYAPRMECLNARLHRTDRIGFSPP